MQFNLDDLTAKDIIEVERYSGIPVTNWNLEMPSMGMMVGIIYVMLRREKPRLKLTDVEGWNMTQLQAQAERLFPADDEEPEGNVTADSESANTAPSTSSAWTSSQSSSNDSRVSPLPTTGPSQPTNVSRYERASRS